ncbi:hypothetical protein [Curtobacterium caseinilyticum]|uniref:Meckel syndrome type 1 protein n=1 Tax=Curtobacterium caseinilyticum TaxID=3055137 RepID=A0ABT7TPL7_9MICO|nr:hypothetical protein [Curtobacterium caseinilyticum]MDM7891465.1 hypothetical protein [Curtobacterium caseinilyticum]
MPDRDRPRRAVPAWVVAPPEDTADGREAQPAPAPQAPVVEVVASSTAPASVPEVAAVADRAAAGSSATGSSASGSAAAGSAAAGSVSPGSSAAAPAGSLSDVDVIVPDYPPEEHLLPPAPTSPAVQVPSFDTAPLPVSPVDAVGDPGPGTDTPAAAAGSVVSGPTPRASTEQTRAPLTPPTDPTHDAAQRGAAHREPVQPVSPAIPVVGQPRFSVPGLEHVLVEGSEPEPSGPIGYRTPARFARQQAPRPVVADPPATPFDAVIAPPAGAAAVPTAVFPAVADAPTGGTAPTVDGSAEVATRPEAEAPGRDGGAASLQAGARPPRDRALTTVGATPAAVVGAVTGLGALGLAAWWFTAPATVHAAGLVLGVLALVLSGRALRDPAATWQRPVALLGAVLGGVGTLVLLWAVASALLPLAGVTLPDLTGTGVVPTVAP